MGVKIVSDHGWPKSSAGDDGNALAAFRNEREYVAHGGRNKTTVVAMDWAHREIMRMGSTLLSVVALSKAGTIITPEELVRICERGLGGLSQQIEP